jgi:hypothetical protein
MVGSFRLQAHQTVYFPQEIHLLKDAEEKKCLKADAL